MPQQPFVIGVDGGGSQTTAVVLDQTGRILGQGQSGSTNYQNVGLAKTKAALETALTTALHSAQLVPTNIEATTLALAGAGRAEDRQILLTIATELLPNVSIAIEHDALAALVGGLNTRVGVLLIAGTGMIAYGENEQGQQARAGGWGYLLDRGSGYALGLKAIQAVAASTDQRDLQTRLTDCLLTQLALKQPSDLIPWLYAPNRTVSEIAALAKPLLAEAENGDIVAVEIVAQEATALAEAAVTVATRLQFKDDLIPLVFSGGLLIHNTFYRCLVEQAVHIRTPRLQCQLPQAPPAIGAARLALQRLGYTPSTQPTPQEIPSTLWASEQRNYLTRDLDLGTTLGIIGAMHLADQQAVQAIRSQLETIAEVIDHVADKVRQGGRLIYVGAGTSGRLGVLDASECPPTFNSEADQVMGVIAGGHKALTTAVEGAEDDETAGAEAVRQLNVGDQDSIIGIAASGRTPFAIGALLEARKQRALTIALTCNLPAPLTTDADYVIAPLVGPEILTGSTRLKAGTAQKLVLNMLSTGVMIRLGKTYSNLMVDVQPSNQKLQARARHIVAQACQIDESLAADLLLAANGSVKVAIVSQLLACPPNVAQQKLSQTRGIIRAALAKG